MGRAAAGYVNFKEGGVGPVLLRIIPLAERMLFKIYASTLLQGPAIDSALQASLVLTLLLHHEEVSLEYPQHRLIIEMRHALTKCNISEAMFAGWIQRTKQFNSEANKSGLTLSQVWILYTSTIYMNTKFFNGVRTDWCIFNARSITSTGHEGIAYFSQMQCANRER